MKTVNLTQFIARGSDVITAVAVRKPDVGALRGLKMTDVLQMDVNAMLLVLPRVTEPALLPAEVASMDPADFLTLSGTLVSFFMTPDQQAQLATAPH